MKPSTELRVGRVRGMVPRAVLPAFVRARAKLAWSREAVREDARSQMRFILEHTRPDADIDAAARLYVERQMWRGELRWHPDILTNQQVEGLEHLVAARDLGRGVVLSQIHHGHFEGAFASISRRGVQLHVMGYPELAQPDAAGWKQQLLAVALSYGGIWVPADVGVGTLEKILVDGGILTVASDVPGRTPMRFLGRDVIGSFGAVRLATATGAPVVVMTAERSDGHLPVVRLHEHFDPRQFPSPQKLLDAILAVHEPCLVRWPELYDIPTSHWGIPVAAVTTGPRRG